MIQCTRCVAGITSSWYPQIQQIDWKAKPRQTSGSMHLPMVRNRIAKILVLILITDLWFMVFNATFNNNSNSHL
jgi:hypothetical protein